MNIMFFSSRAPFMTMASADYYPYPVHTAEDPLPRRGRTTPRSTYAGPARLGRSFKRTLTASKPVPKPKPVERIDSGFDNASDTSSITLNEEVERRLALEQFLLRHHHAIENENEDNDVTKDDEGNLGRRARDSIDMNIERASTWESKKIRAKRNRRSKLTMMKKWLKRLIYPGSDGSSWLLTASL